MSFPETQVPVTTRNHLSRRPPPSPELECGCGRGRAGVGLGALEVRRPVGGSRSVVTVTQAAALDV